MSGTQGIAMPKVRSINQTLPADTLPDFRNLGVTLRIVLLANAAALLLAAAQASSWLDGAHKFIDSSTFIQPVLLTSLLMLFALNQWFSRLDYRRGAALVALLVGVVALAIFLLGRDLYASPMERGYFHAWRNAVLGAVGALLLLAYFRLRSQALSPALQNARLQALQARIRPHFLFNSINAVLSVVRADPKRAETALEDMADLFRMAMADDQELVPLRREVELSRQYLALEQLRLGERLTVNWQIDEALQDALMPPLMLQPLLENAVYHGIEPMDKGGVIDIRLQLLDGGLHLDVHNPGRPRAPYHQGNKMALANIRERLALLFDVEAQYTVESSDDFYHVHIQIPYVREESR
jgi:two-component system sensor histidine kinase AlgZ